MKLDLDILKIDSKAVSEDIHELTNRQEILKSQEQTQETIEELKSVKEDKVKNDELYQEIKRRIL